MLLIALSNKALRQLVVGCTSRFLLPFNEVLNDNCLQDQAVCKGDYPELLG